MPHPQQHVDLIALIEKHAGIRLKRKARTDSGEYVGPCPWCPVSTDSFLVWPNSERPHWNHVRGCRRNGDAISFLQEFVGMSFREACDELNIDPEEAREERIAASNRYDTNNAPPLAWQERAREFLHQCRYALWSSRGDEARAWLHHRGLTDDTIKQAELGYCPIFYQDELAHWGLCAADVDRDEVRVPEGIIIPWYYRNDLWKLSVRRLHPTDNQPKYGQVVGSCEGLYLVDDVRAGQPVMIVEGEFDALSVRQEAGSLIACVATGSTKRGYTHRWLTLLNNCPTILQSFDDDEGGKQGARRWQHTFPETQIMRWLPAAHDANEMLTSDISIRYWVKQGLEWFARLPPPVQQAHSVSNDDNDLPLACSVCGALVERYSDGGTAYCCQHYPLQGSSPIQEQEDEFPDYEEPEANEQIFINTSIEDAGEENDYTPEQWAIAEVIAEVRKNFGPLALHVQGPDDTLTAHIRQRQEVREQAEKERLSLHKARYRKYP